MQGTKNTTVYGKLLTTIIAPLPPPQKKVMASYECFSGPFLLAEQRPVAFSTYTTVDGHILILKRSLSYAYCVRNVESNGCADQKTKSKYF